MFISYKDAETQDEILTVAVNDDNDPISIANSVFEKTVGDAISDDVIVKIVSLADVEHPEKIVRFNGEE